MVVARNIRLHAADNDFASSALPRLSEKATEIIKRFLKEKPTPTRYELHNMHDKVQKQLVLEQAQRITGDSSLSASPDSQPLKAEVFSWRSTFIDHGVFWSAVGLGTLILGVACFKAIRRGLGLN